VFTTVLRCAMVKVSSPCKRQWRPIWL
jgi:hypothetical protein